MSIVDDRLHYFSVFLSSSRALVVLHSFPTRRSSDLRLDSTEACYNLFVPLHECHVRLVRQSVITPRCDTNRPVVRVCGLRRKDRSEEHTSELQSLRHLVCRLLLEKKKKTHSSSVPRY